MPCLWRQHERSGPTNAHPLPPRGGPAGIDSYNGVVNLLNADLHCHSIVSDGTLSPADVAARAKGKGVELWALTDHDEVAGQQLAAQAARDIGLPYLAGVEISVSFAGRTVHIVGLGIDPEDGALQAGLAATRDGREQRAREMADSLGRVGIEGAFDGALDHAGNPALIARTHFARWMVQTGVCSDAHEVFRRYLTEGKPGFVPHRWAALGDAVRWITNAGGLAVVAHPARYKFTANEEYALFSEFKAHGGRGVEVLTSSHHPSDAVRYVKLALEFGLLASRGSDFHSPQESRIDLGGLPDLPATVVPVWSELQHRIRHP